MRAWHALIFIELFMATAFCQTGGESKVVCLRGQVIDAVSEKTLPARIYIQGADGKWHFPRSASPAGSAVHYKKTRAGGKSVEMHTTLSAHPFVIDLPRGQYTLTVERGHEYFSLTRKIDLQKDADLKLPLKRWIKLAERGWYSGETHVHRSLEELPNVMLAEDLNVAFPLVWWVTKAYAPPRSGNRSTKKPPAAKVIAVDKTHLIWPRNTEYEIFAVGGKRHTLGAFFIIHHQSIFEKGVPPVGPIAQKAHAEHALLELDKPNWPWSIMLIPIMKIDLYELSNNHVWRTKFGFPNFGVQPPKFMKIERDLAGMTENGWIDYNFKNYYTLLNCGFRLRPTAGTASGVHPVPLGFGRAYVYCGDEFSLSNWAKGLNNGRSFITTGPMLFATVNGKLPGQKFQQKTPTANYVVQAKTESALPLERIEVVVNGEVRRYIEPANRKSKTGVFHSNIKMDVQVDSTSWIAIRCFEKRADGRYRFAHTAPVHIEVAGKPLLPRREKIGFLIERVEDELKRHRGVLPEAALAEYRRGLAIYKNIAKNTR